MTFINVGSIKWFKWLVLVWLVISDLYLFHLIVLLNPNFNCSKKLLSSVYDKVTTRTYNFVSVILNVSPVGFLILDAAGFPPWAETASLVATQFSDHVEIRFISQLVDGMSSVF